MWPAFQGKCRFAGMLKADFQFIEDLGDGLDGFLVTA